MSRKYIYIHHNHVKFPITNKTGRLKVQINASFCKNIVAVAINIWNTACNFQRCYVNEIRYFKTLYICRYLNYCLWAILSSLVQSSVLICVIAYLWHSESSVSALFVIPYRYLFFSKPSACVTWELGKN